jgi:NADH-quinone oxidoreductase subunit C
MSHTESLGKLSQRCGADALQVTEFRDNCRVRCSVAVLLDVLHCLKDECGFDMLVDLTAVDYSEYPQARDRFGVIYALVSTKTKERLWVKVWLNEPELELPSVVSLWQGANWLEREVYDMFGIRFHGHLDLRRILLPDEFAAFPLRKDYPLQGRGERHNFPRLTREES